MLNFNLETDQESYKRAMINSTSWEDQARHALLRSSVVERRTSHLVDLAGREVEALRLEDDLTKLLAKADRSQSSIEREMFGRAHGLTLPKGKEVDEGSQSEAMPQLRAACAADCWLSGSLLRCMT